MTAQALRYRWTQHEFIRAATAGVFDERVELVDGEVWPVVIGDWHGPTTMRCAHLLTVDDVVVTQESLATGDSLPGPDFWVRSTLAEPTAKVSPRLSRWAADDVLLVVEVSDETVVVDLNTKSRLYGAAGYPVYWVITREAVFEHTRPDADGYRSVVRYRPGDRIPVPYADTSVAVGDLVGPG